MDDTTRLAAIEAAITARLPDDADEFARMKAQQLARLQFASECMTARLATGRRVDQTKLVRLLNTIRRAEHELHVKRQSGWAGTKSGIAGAPMDTVFAKARANGLARFLDTEGMAIKRLWAKYRLEGRRQPLREIAVAAGLTEHV